MVFCPNLSTPTLTVLEKLVAFRQLIELYFACLKEIFGVPTVRDKRGCDIIVIARNTGGICLVDVETTTASRAIETAVVGVFFAIAGWRGNCGSTSDSIRIIALCSRVFLHDCYIVGVETTTHIALQTSEKVLLKPRAFSRYMDWSSSMILFLVVHVTGVTKNMTRLLLFPRLLRPPARIN